MNTKRDMHLIEIGDDEQVLVPLFFLPSTQIFGQVHHCDHYVSGLEDALHCGMRMGHGMYRCGHQDLPHLCHIDPIEIPVNGKLHNFDLICPCFQ